MPINRRRLSPVARTRGAGLAMVAIWTSAIVLVGGAFHTSKAAAAPTPTVTSYVWGADDSPFVNGVVCTDPKTHLSIPLVAWDLGNNLSPAFLMDGLTSDGHTDSGKVPFVSLPGQTTTPYVGANLDVVAALMRVSGGSADAATLGEVAELVEEATGTSTGRQCLAAKKGGMSPTHAAALLKTAQDQSGPFTVTVKTTSPLLRRGSSTELVAHVTSAAGKPVQGASVTFDSPSKDIVLSSKTAITDASGDAVVAVTLLTAHDGSAPVTAKADIAAGLTQVTAQGAVRALVLAKPTSFVGTGQVVITTRANPVITAGADSPAVGVNIPITPSLTIGGMNGHTGTVALNVYGPLAMPSSGLCAEITNDAWQKAIAKDSSHKLLQQAATAPIGGDSVVKGDPIVSKTPGCYAVTGSVTTLDSDPNITRAADFSNGAATLSILDTTVSATLDHSGVVKPGDPMSLTLAVTRSHGWATSVDATLDGPVTTPINGCADANWTGAKRVWADTFHSTGDGKASFTSTPLPKVGCYRLSGVVRVDTGTGLVARWPLPLPTGVSGVLVLQPRILEALPDATSAVVPKTVSDNVFISGLAGQPGKLTIEMYQAPWGGAPGCDNVDWSKATKIAVGKPTPLTGDGWHAAPSPATVNAGCVSLVPVVTLDANAAVTGRGTVGSRYSAIIVAAPEAAPFTLKQTKKKETGYLKSHAMTVGGFVLAAIALAGIAAALISMNSSRSFEARDASLHPEDGTSPFDDEHGDNPFNDDTGEIPSLVGTRTP